MPHRALVEAVDLELEAVEVELLHEVALEEARRLVGDVAAAEVRVDREAAEVRDAASPVRALEAHRAGPFSVDLDDEDAECVRLRLRALDLRAHGVRVLRPDGGEKRLHVLVCEELDEEAHVVRSRAPDRDQAGSSCARVRSSCAPDASATPARMSARPASAAALTGSSRNAAP